MNPRLLQLHNCIIYGKPPSQFVDFGEFSVEFFLRHYTGLSPYLTDNILLLEKCVEINNVPGKDAVKCLPEPLFDALLNMYRDFQFRSLHTLTVQMEEYLQSDESRAQWLLAKAAGVSTALTLESGELNPFQRTWIVRNSLQDKVDHTDLIVQVIDILKPWLDKELYAQVQDRITNTRENVMFAEEDESAVDQRIRDQAAASAEAADIIRIKESQ